jgi:hypothetical protein
LRSRSVVTAAAAVGIAVALIAAPLASSTPAHKGITPAQAAVRASLGTYLQNLRDALIVASRRPQTAHAVAPELNKNLHALASATRQVASLTGDQLDAVQAGLGPTTLRGSSSRRS